MWAWKGMKQQMNWRGKTASPRVELTPIRFGLGGSWGNQKDGISKHITTLKRYRRTEAGQGTLTAERPRFAGGSIGRFSGC